MTNFKYSPTQMCVVCLFLIDVKHLFITLQIIVAALHSAKIDDNSS